MDENKIKNRAYNYIKMIETEVMYEILDILNRGNDIHKIRKLKEMKLISSLIIIKTIMNIHSKNGLSCNFINEMFGEQK